MLSLRGLVGSGAACRLVLRVLQEMLVLRDISEVPEGLMGDGRAVCP
jgi:hypothetical protein